MVHVLKAVVSWTSGMPIGQVDGGDECSYTSTSHVKLCEQVSKSIQGWVKVPPTSLAAIDGRKMLYAMALKVATGEVSRTTCNFFGYSVVFTIEDSKKFAPKPRTVKHSTSEVILYLDGKVMFRWSVNVELFGSDIGLGVAEFLFHSDTKAIAALGFNKSDYVAVKDKGALHSDTGAITEWRRKMSNGRDLRILFHAPKDIG